MAKGDAASVVSKVGDAASVVSKVGDASVMSVASTPLVANCGSDGVSLEGWLLKQGSRTQAWHERYFVLNGNVISYHEQRSEVPNAKGTFVISNEAGCDVGSLYIDQRQKGSKKELLYCLKVTWSTMEPATSKEDADDEAAQPTPPSDNLSLPPVDSGLQTPNGASRAVSSIIRQDSAMSADLLPESRPSSSDGEKRSILRRKKSNAKSKDRTPKPPKPSTRMSRTRSTPASGRETPNNFRQSSAPSSAHSPRDDQSEIIESPPKARHHRRYRSDGNFLVGNDHLATPVLNDAEKEEERSVLLPRTGSRSTLERTFSGGTTREEIRHQLVVDKQREQYLQEQQLMQSLYYATKKANRKKTKKMIVGGTKIAAAAGAAAAVGVLTAGVGLLAGLVFIGGAAAAGGTGVVAGAGYKIRKKKHGEMVIGTPNYELARRWKDALDACLTSETVKQTTWGQMFTMEGRNTASAVLPTSAGLVSVLSRDSMEEWTGRRDEKAQQFVDPETQWRPMENGWATFLGTGAHGLRIFREDRQSPKHGLSVAGRPNPPLKGQIVLNATPLDSFMCLMSLPRVPSTTGMRLPLMPNSGQRASFRVLESLNAHMDIIHLVFHPLFLFPTWTAPRDFVLFRYWRLEPDGTYVVCCDSVQHPLCPPHPGYTRGEMNGVYTISPRKKLHVGQTDNTTVPECLLTALVQVDPRGWVPNKPIPVLANQGYGEAFAVSALLQLLDIRDALDYDRFVPVASDIHRPLEPHQGQRQIVWSESLDSLEDDDDPVNYDFAYSEREVHAADTVGEQGFMYNPPPLPIEKWAEPDSNSFRVRGKRYKTDKRKINAGSSIGRLIAVDVVTVEKTIHSGFCNHPTERMQLALERERKLKEKGLETDLPPFIFVVNICLPGPPFYHGVFYYAIDDMSSIDGSDGTPSSKLCKEFFFGDSDEFRDRTFKLIPQIVEGNFIVRKAVGNTPAIMGTKLKQTYARSDRFCEVILDCGSSSVATGVIRLSLGYCQELVVDMGFLFEGKDESTLPERIFGASRVKKLLFGPHLRFVKEPPP